MHLFNNVVLAHDMSAILIILFCFLVLITFHETSVSLCVCLCCHAVSVCPSVTFANHVKTNKHILEIFSPLGSDTILVYPYQMECRYSDGNPPPLTGATNAKGCDKMPIFHKYLAVSQIRLYIDGHMQRDSL